MPVPNLLLVVVINASSLKTPLTAWMREARYQVSPQPVLPRDHLADSAGLRLDGPDQLRLYARLRSRC